MPATTVTTSHIEHTAPSVTHAIASYETRLRAQGCSERTVSCYLRDLRLFAGVMERLFPEHGLGEITPGMVDVVLTDERLTSTPAGRPKSPATMHRMKVVVKSFFSWAEETGLTESNAARSVTMKRLSRRPPEFLSDAEQRRLLKELHDRSSALARRDRVIFELFLGTGIRLSELVNLDTDDIDLDGKHIHIVGKGGVPQIKFLKTSLRTLLRAYMKERSKQAPSGIRALFLSTRGDRLCCRQVAQRLSYWLAKAGVTKKITPHGLRHTFATHLYAKTSDLLLVKRALGHRDISTTEIYTHLADSALEDAIERL